MPRAASRFVVAVTAGLLAISGLSLRAPAPAQAISPNVVISQVYGGGGNSGATLKNDFIELFNRGTSSVSLAGWSVQYASATGTGNFGANTGQITELPSATLAPGQYLLIQEAQGTGGSTDLPTPDVTDSTPINMSGTAGKVALVTTTTSLGCNGGSTPCDAAALALIVDLVGYGNANFFEGTGATPAPSNTTAVLRAADGCTDTDDNAADFSADAPTPRNTASPLHVCSTTPTLSLSIDDVSLAEGNSGTTAFDFTVSLSAPAGSGGVTFDIATADDTATVADGDYAAKALTGQTIAAGSSTYSFSVAVNGDVAVEPTETFEVNVTNVTGATVSDGQGIGTILNDDCGSLYTPIYDIQGSGMSAAITGNVVTEGVVVGDFDGSIGIGGFYIQDPVGDADGATSDGIFVYTSTADSVSAGQHVRISGYARERFSQTTINGSNSNSAPVTDIVVCGAGTTVAPVDVTMPFASTTSLERFEGMLVRFPQPLVISEYFNYDRFGEMVLALPMPGEDRLFTPTNVVEPGAPANDLAAEYALRRITLDDGLGIQNPTFTRHPNGAGFALDNRFRGGDTVANTTGVLGYDFGLYRIQPTVAADYTPANPRPAAPEDVGGRLTVASMNTLNYFLTIDDGSNNCGPGQDVNCRGADNAEEFTRQRDKLLAALEGLDADVVGLNEMENTTGKEPLADIVDGLNDALGSGTYAFIDTGTIGTDAIKVGFIYRPASVTPVGGYEVLDSSVDPRFDDSKNRPALAQTFQENATGERFTVVVNHLKSKGSACTDVGDPDAGDGQGNCNGTRELAAQALVDWLATDPTRSGDPDFLIIGDLNSYAMEDPITAVKAGPDDLAGTADDYTNLIAAYQGPDAYSYVFDGQAGYLDHALANATLVGQVTGAADWHINADEPDILDYDTTFKSTAQDSIYAPDAYRSSDHDPLVLGLGLDAPPTIEIVAGGSCTPNGGTFLATVGDLQTPAAALTLALTGNTNTGLVPNANVVLGGSGANRTISITIATGQTGTAALTFSLGDGVNTTDQVIMVIAGGNGPDSLVGTSGSDLILGGNGDDEIWGGDGADLLCGGKGADVIAGGDGDDTIEGERGDDILFGDEGDDVLRGGRGDDTLTGDAGADLFDGGPGNDVITDLSPGEGDSGS